LFNYRFLLETTAGIVFCLVGTIHLIGAGSASQSDRRLPNNIDRTRSNIIFISLDTLRRGGLDKSSLPEWPAGLKSYVEDSVYFKNLVSPSSWTLPAHASVFTGLKPYEHKALMRGRDQIDTNVRYYPEQLSENGYQTVAFTDGGFVESGYGFDRGFDRYVDGDVSPEHSLQENINRAQDWLSQERSSDHPFFMFLHTYQIHDYYRMRDTCLNQMKQKTNSLYKRLFSGSQPPGSIWTLPNDSSVTIRGAKWFYDCEVRQTLMGLSGFLKWLRLKNLYRTTTIILYSDHGEGFSLEPKIIGHGGGQLYESLVRVPGFVKFAGQSPPGGTVETQMPVEHLLPFVRFVMRNGFENNRSVLSMSDSLPPNIPKRFGKSITFGSGYKQVTSETGPRLSPVFFARTNSYKLIESGQGELHYYELSPRTMLETRVQPETIPESIQFKLRNNLSTYMKKSKPVYQDDFQRIRQFRSQDRPDDGKMETLKGLGYFE